MPPLQSAKKQANMTLAGARSRYATHWLWFDRFDPTFSGTSAQLYSLLRGQRSQAALLHLFCVASKRVEGLTAMQRGPADRYPWLTNLHMRLAKPLGSCPTPQLLGVSAKQALERVQGDPEVCWCTSCSVSRLRPEKSQRLLSCSLCSGGSRGWHVNFSITIWRLLSKSLRDPRDLCHSLEMHRQACHQSRCFSNL
jgi:hypothetical protein